MIEEGLAAALGAGVKLEDDTRFGDCECRRREHQRDRRCEWRHR